jgi:diguanylate cyclase (GGDEF)-like protein
MLSLVQKRLDDATAACAELGAMHDLVLSAEQAARLERQRSRLADSLAGIVANRLGALSGSSADESGPHESELPRWTREPHAADTGLPTRDTLEANLAALFESGRHGRGGAVLLVSLDRPDQLRQRHGEEAVAGFLKTVVRLVLAGIRDEDLACESGDATFAVLMPHVATEAALRTAESLRTTVRQSKFHAGPQGPEVLVTASYGFADCPSGDNPLVAYDRATDALARSRKAGRNQLHWHDGTTVRAPANPV